MGNQRYRFLRTPLTHLPLNARFALRVITTSRLGYYYPKKCRQLPLAGNRLQD